MDSNFVNGLEGVVGKEKASVIVSALASDSSVSVRLNPSKKPERPVEILDGAAQVPWCSEGFLLKSRPSFTLDPLLHCGAYYVQDSSAMFVGEIFSKVLRASEKGFVTVLDLCAAPGGKTTHAAAVLRKYCGDSFVLVANEVMRQRATVLAGNVALWGDPNVIVTSVDPKAFDKLEGFFDIIIADVPCSGEGMFRKDPKAVADWSPDTVALCEARQRRILSDVWPSLAEGGHLVYSTCTFNEREDDGNVCWCAENLGGDVIGEFVPDFDGCTVSGVIKTSCGRLLAPGFVPGEGQYCAVVRKNGEDLRSASGRGAGKVSDFLSGFVTEPVVERRKGDLVIAVPEVIAGYAAELESLHPILMGVEVGTVKGKTLVPSADLALSIIASKDAFPSVELDRQTALRFLHRDSFSLEEAPQGFVRLVYDGLPLGFVKNLGRRCNNLLPQERRIRMEINQ